MSFGGCFGVFLILFHSETVDRILQTLVLTLSCTQRVCTSVNLFLSFFQSVCLSICFHPDTTVMVDWA